MLFIIGIPLLLIAFGVLRLVFGTRVHSSLKTGLAIFLGANVVSFFLFGSLLARNFDTRASTNAETIDLSGISSDTLTIKVNNPQNWEGTPIGFLGYIDGQMSSQQINLQVVKAVDNEFVLETQFFSRGKNGDNARENIKSFEYPPQATGFNTLELPRYFSLIEGSSWRVQEVRMVLRVPVGKKIVFEKGSSLMNTTLEFRPGSKKHWASSGEIYLMTPDGLECTTCENKNQQHFDDPFTKIQIDGKIKVDVQHDHEAWVEIEAEDRYRDQVEIETVGDVLHISSNLKQTSSPIRIRIGVPELESIRLDSTDDVRIHGFEQEKMAITANGRFELKTICQLDSLVLRQSGENKTDLRGQIGYMEAFVDQRADLDAEKAEIGAARVNVSQSARAKLNAQTQLQETVRDSTGKVIIRE